MGHELAFRLVEDELDVAFAIGFENGQAMIRCVAVEMDERLELVGEECSRDSDRGRVDEDGLEPGQVGEGVVREGRDTGRAARRVLSEVLEERARGGKQEQT